MSLYSEYLKELGIRQCVECEEGFMTYVIKGEECYITDVYVRPSGRKTGAASRMADEIAADAKSKGCTYLLGTVSILSKTKTEALKVLLAYGFKLSQSDSTGLYLTKEL